MNIRDARAVARCINEGLDELGDPRVATTTVEALCEEFPEFNWTVNDEFKVSVDRRSSRDELF
jgi:hypothetical protein